MSLYYIVIYTIGSQACDDATIRFSTEHDHELVEAFRLHFFDDTNREHDPEGWTEKARGLINRAEELAPSSFSVQRGLHPVDCEFARGGGRERLLILPVVMDY